MLTAVGVAAAGVAVLAGGYLVASQPPRAGDERELGRIVRQVASLARETALLARLVREGSATDNFVKTHRDKLEDTLSEQSDALDAPFLPAVRADAGAVRDDVAALSSLLTTFQRGYDQPAVLEATQREASEIARRVAAREPPR